MIENDVIDYLESDGTLDTLLVIGTSDTKIYPDDAPQDTILPYIIFNVGIGMLDENIDEDKIDFKIYSDNRDTIASIRDRIKTLLDKQDEIRGVITSTNFWIYWSKLTAGFTLMDNERKTYVCLMSFNIKYNKKQI